MSDILIVDDERDIRELLVLSLSRMGLAVTAVGSVGEAMTAVDAGVPFALVLTDMRLPDGAGLALMLCALFYCCQIDNIVYSASDTAMRATENFCSRLVERIESQDGYRDGMEVLIIGSYPADRYYSDIKAYDLVKHYSCDADSTIALNKQIYYFIDRWLNVPIEEPKEQELIDMAASPEFAAMPLYPDDGSTAVINGRLVVKLQNTYTPKQDYEIQYENRR